MEYCWEMSNYAGWPPCVTERGHIAPCSVMRRSKCCLADKDRCESHCEGADRGQSDSLTIWQTSNERVLLISLFDVALPAARLPSCPPGCWQYVWLRGRGCLLAVCSSSINPQCYLPCCRPARLTRPLQLSQSSQFSLSACQGWRVTHILRHNSRTTSPHSWHCWKHQITKTGH